MESDLKGPRQRVDIIGDVDAPAALPEFDLVVGAELVCLTCGEAFLSVHGEQVCPHCRDGA